MSASPPDPRADAPEAAGVGLADRLRSRTGPLHVRAERSGFVAELLRGRGSRDGYALLLRGLLPVYEALETGLERLGDRPALRDVARPAVYRATALASDLEALRGPQWHRELPLLPAARRYAASVAAAARRDGSLLLAHAYTRYLGDLNGGRFLQRRLADSLGLGSEALAFYAYPHIADLDDFKRRYREAIDRAGALVDAEAVADEACEAFRHNIALSLEVQQQAGEAAQRPAG